MINSPLNYPGNKSRIVEEIVTLFPKKINKMYEPFVGSGIVSMNTTANLYILNDASSKLIELLDYFINSSGQKIVDDVDEIINNYGFTNTYEKGLDNYLIIKHEGLSNYNRVPYNNLREDYNENPTSSKLYALIIFGFNHYLRFNKKGIFNVPVGKVDFTYSLREKTIQTCNRFRELEITLHNLDVRQFIKDCSKNFQSDDFFYFDPPYLITLAPYNSGWSNQDEEDLYKYLDFLNEKGVNFALSNAIEANGKRNETLIEWMKKYNVTYIKRNYLNSNYRKKNISPTIEVLIKNY